MARYMRGPFRLYGGYIYARLSNPSDDYVNGFPTIAQGIFVPPGAVTSNAYTVNRILNTVWSVAIAIGPIQQAIWLYLRFTLSLRDVEDLLAERGVAVSYETVRRWVTISDRRSRPTYESVA